MKPSGTFSEDNPAAGRLALLRAAGILLASVTVWKWTSHAPAQIIMWGGALWALGTGYARLGVWRSRTGVLFGAVALYALAALAWSRSPGDSARDATRLAAVLAVTVALPALSGTARRVVAAVHASAAALTAILAADLVRLALKLGPDLLRAAHACEPFALGHSPNVGGAAAGAACLALGLAAFNPAFPRRGRAAAAAGAAVDAAYLFVIASRGAQVALAAAVLVAALLVPRRPALRAAALAVCLVALALLAAKPELINQRFRERLSMRGFADRDIVWKHTWRLVGDAPLLGYGYGPRVFQAVYHGSHPPPARFHFEHPHSYWVATLFAYGWIGAGLLFAAWASLAWDLLRSAGRAGPLAAHYPALALTVLLAYVHAFGIGDFPGSQVRMLMLWMVPLALVVTRDPARKSAPAGGGAFT
jgi:hypothetical protein